MTGVEPFVLGVELTCARALVAPQQHARAITVKIKYRTAFIISQLSSVGASLRRFPPA